MRKLSLAVASPLASKMWEVHRYACPWLYTYDIFYITNIVSQTGHAVQHGDGGHRDARHTFVIGEGNSASCGGQTNVSDAFAAALWAVDFLSMGMLL